jgi:hypothetical protein
MRRGLVLWSSQMERLVADMQGFADEAPPGAAT